MPRRWPGPRSRASQSTSCARTVTWGCAELERYAAARLHLLGADAGAGTRPAAAGLPVRGAG